MDRNSRTASIDQELCLYIDKDLHVVIVEGKDKTSWLNAAFQSICRNVRITESSEEMGISIPSLRPLSPRLPTTGEEYYLEGDYSVKLTTREIEIKFFSESLFTNFKRALLHKYPTMSWSKYLQRDCAIIKMENHKTVTLHLWEDICSLWFSGPGRRDWFNNEFHEIHKSATQEGVEVAYTEKRLMNGYEVEFISMDYVMTLKAFLERDYPSASWEKTRLCHVIKLEPTVGSPVTLYLPRSGSLERKIWIFKTPYCTAWYNQDFHKLLAEAESCLQRRKLTTNLPEECMTPVESSL